jgi:hypothetical protein
MMEGKGLSLPGGIRGAEISVEPYKGKPRHYDFLAVHEMMPLRTA